MIKLNQVRSRGRVSLIADFSYFKTIYIKAFQNEKITITKNHTRRDPRAYA